MAINSRAKGAGFENKICGLLKKLTHREWVRTPGSGAVATRTGNLALAGDIMPVNFKCAYVFECKKYKEYNLESLITQKGDLWKWYIQLQRECKSKKGILVFSRNYGKVFVLAETDEQIPNTIRYGEYLVGLFDNIMPILMQRYIK